MKTPTDVAIENRIRILIESSRIRLNDFFIDYDRLRSGYVTKAQFRRVMDQVLKLPLTDEEISILANKYDTKNNSNVNYKQFCSNINLTFPDNDLRDDPQNHIFKNPEYLGTFRSMRALDLNEEKTLKEILTNLNNYYSKRNIDILTSFRDFDRNNIGVLTESQFRRCITEPMLSDELMFILIRKYQHPDKAGCINYLNFYNDIKSNQEQSQSINTFSNSTLRKGESVGISVQEIIDKISVACHKYEIRIVDFFKDYDRLRSGIITERQFSTALSLAVQKEAALANDDINQLTEYFKMPDDRVDYKNFCDTVENVFTIPDMEKKPLARVVRPPRGILSKTMNGNLTPGEEDAVSNCLNIISDKVRKFKLQLFPYFKDFDRSTAFTRNISKIQFGRVLNSLSLMPDPTHFGLLCKKFEDPINGDVNYPTFCQAVDEEYVGSKIEDILAADESGSVKLEQTDLPIDTSNVDLNELIARLRSHTLSNRLRVKEVFQDMDPLNSGAVTKSQFIRCLSFLGISSLGAFNINKAQTEALCKEYKQPNDAKKVNWKKFEEDIESVFTLRELEKSPNALVACTQKFVMPPPGTVAWDDEKLTSGENYKDVIERLRQVVSQRRLDCWPPFKDYDKLNRGHVTKKQFYQSLNKLGIELPEKDVAVLEAKFLNNLGFNYVQFLSTFQPTIVEGPKYLELRKELSRINTQKPIYESKPLNDVQSVLVKIKDLAYKNRVSIYEWLRDHDKLNSGKMLKETFKRAIDLCNLNIQLSEIELIINHYTSDKDDRMVEYKRFCMDIESAFAVAQLEKNPLVEPEQHSPLNTIDANQLVPNEQDYLRVSLNKIADRVRKERIQLFPRFEDFDRVKNGHVTQNQFKRVMNDLKLASMLNDVEVDGLLKNYSVRIGTRDDFNYISFCDKIYELGSFEYRNP